MSIPWQLTGPAVKPVLLMEPHGVQQPNALALRGEVIEIPQGPRIVESGPAPESGRHAFRFVCANRAELDFLESFFDAMQGRAGAFWFPTWQWEFDVAGFENPNAGSYFLYVKRWGYVEQMFPLGSQFRQLIVLHGDRYHTFTTTSVAASVASGIDALALGEGGDRSTLDLPGAAFGTIRGSDDAYRPLWLRWGRFDQDTLTAETLNAEEGTATVDLSIVELPAEVPL